MKRYFLTDNSGAPIKIESLSIANEEIVHGWSYDNERDLLRVFNEKAQVLNGTKIKARPILRFVVLSIVYVLSFVGFEHIMRLY